MASSTKCSALTLKGEPCSRKAAKGCGAFCTQHFTMNAKKDVFVDAVETIEAVEAVEAVVATAPFEEAVEAVVATAPFEEAVEAVAEELTCIALTQKGPRCSRKTAKGCGAFCKQHFTMNTKVTAIAEEVAVATAPVAVKVADELTCSALTQKGKGPRCSRATAKECGCFCKQHFKMSLAVV